MRRLQARTTAAVTIDSLRLDCVAAAVNGSEALLVPKARMPELPDEGRPAFLVFFHKGREVAVRGRLTPGPTDTSLRFFSADRVQVANQRRHHRLPIAAPGVLRPVDAPGVELPISARDLSARGALVGGASTLADDTLVDLEIQLRGGITISVRSRLVRQVGEFTAFEHVDGGATDLDELAQLIDLVLVEFARRAAPGAESAAEDAA
jgi:hypothetical protein